MSSDLIELEERLVRISVLEELTVAALDLFDASSPVDRFLERVAERLGCVAGVLTGGTEEGLRLMGSVGLPRSMVQREQSAESCEAFRSAVTENQDGRLVEWHLPLDRKGGRDDGSHASCLALFFDAAQVPAPKYRAMMERLAPVLHTVLSHRRLYQALDRSYRELGRAQAELVQRERLAALGELAAVIAHEVRNPLSAILNSLALMQRASTSAELSRNLLQIITEEASRLNRIVSDLLDFAKPHHARVELGSIEPVVTEAIDAARKFVSTSATTHLKLDVSHAAAEARFDSRLLRQALVNLVVNALQASPNGTVHVCVAPDVHDARSHIRIEITDDGPGIEPNYCARIFEPFVTTRPTGTGLGLAIVKRIVEAHGGEIRVESELGRGTTFRMWIPVDPRPLDTDDRRSVS